MTVVVADTSPINYLVMIGEISILPQLYGQILIPAEVMRELTAGGTPAEVRSWALAPPGWLLVCNVPFSPPDSALNDLDDGERAAILLAQQQPGALLIVDDSDGRAEAKRRGIANTGTLGVLRAAAVRQLVDLPGALARLSATNFRASQWLIAELLEEDAARKMRTGH
jgi:predicted nucleic acid-binding protein